MPPETKETKPTLDKPDDEQRVDVATDENDESSNEDGLDLEMLPAEISELNDRLDSLSTVLDCIEQQNDDLRAQILLLLDSQRETLKSLKEENVRIKGRDSESTDGDEPMEQY
ncbi:UPF0184 protein AAEL002161-like [Anopheles nili]|uniref:UPF0184 protein AAEL002161-like n=1 Tax=Anopheles nili TaxID=185578 RepID=UPI00237A93B2|nr:UPF0184 protein AAEL002161-like [Anopheles nili]